MVSTAQPNIAYIAAQPQQLIYNANEIYAPQPIYQRSLFYPTRNYGVKVPRQPVYTYPKYHKKYTPTNIYNRRKVHNSRNYQNYQNFYAQNAVNFAAPIPPTSAADTNQVAECITDKEAEEDEQVENHNSENSQNDDSEANSNANKKTAMTLLNELARYNKVIFKEKKFYFEKFI